MRTVVVLCATVVALLAGCTFGPDYQRPALPVPAQHRAAEPPASGQEAVSLADMQWFALFQDERLQELVTTALENNYDVRIAAARVLHDAGEQAAGITLLAAGTDGRDGSTPAAGACIDASTWRIIAERGADPAAALAEHRSHPALESAGALLVTGPTGTNVMDVVIGLVR